MSNTRNIIAVAAFAAAFIFSAGLVRIFFPQPAVEVLYPSETCPFSRSAVEPRGFEKCTARSIENFVREDELNGYDRSGNAYSDDKAESVMIYWRKSSQMDATRFPQDFQDAWGKHMQAWRNYADYLHDRKTSRRNLSRPSEDYYNGEIDRTWDEVLRIGRSYGADID
ncbi:MAG: hypothetical protein JSS81_30340 [Acidobacteria bacterium]|nr:hypothetical protein [Acidobacteriota bacterium]